jgi:hypothetical protein
MNQYIRQRVKALSKSLNKSDIITIFWELDGIQSGSTVTHFNAINRQVHDLSSNGYDIIDVVSGSRFGS